MSTNTLKKLAEVQQKLKAPKNQYNSFGKYKYRSCEDILEGLKAVMPNDCAVTISDEIVEVGGRIYVKATAKFLHGDSTLENTAYAREAETKKGMDESQITGTASSYARKYALNGLFMIDDTKDSDTEANNSQLLVSWWNNLTKEQKEAEWPKLSQPQQKALKEALG